MNDVVPPVGCDLRLVSELIVNGRWCLGQLRMWVSEHEIQEICKVPISRHALDDRLAWAPKKDGVYAVKSGYFQAKMLQNESRVCGANVSFVCSNDLWKVVWGGCFPPKVQHFIWRALQGAVATNLNLFKRKSGFNSLCPICGKEDESIEHLLLTCDWVQMIWFG